MLVRPRGVGGRMAIGLAASMALASCSPGSDADGAGPDRAEEAAEQLYDADVSMAGDGSVWVSGGVVPVGDGDLDQARWIPNDLAVNLTADGAVRSTRAVPLTSDWFLFNSQIVEAAGGRWLVGTECPLPITGGTPGCALETAVVVADVDTGRRLHRPLPELAVEHVGQGLVRALGAVGAQLVLVRAETYDGATGLYGYGVYAWDVTTGAVRSVGTEHSVFHEQSICLAGSSVRLLRPTYGPQGESITTLEIQAVDLAGDSLSWTPVATIGVDGEAHSWSGLACSARMTVVWRQGGDGGTLATYDPLGAAVGESYPLTASQSVDGVSFSRDGGEAVALIKDGAATTSRFVRSTATDGGWTATEPRDVAQTIGQAAIFVEGEPVDGTRYKRIVADLLSAGGEEGFSPLQAEPN